MTMKWKEKESVLGTLWLSNLRGDCFKNMQMKKPNVKENKTQSHWDRITQLWILDGHLFFNIQQDAETGNS